MNNTRIFGPNPGWLVGGPVWLWWVTAGLLLLAAAWILWWSLLRDRSRGRARCPRCFYHLPDAVTQLSQGGEAFECSECGRRIDRSESLFCTNRHWWIASFGLFAVMLAGVSVLVPPVRANGVVSLMPNSVLLRNDRFKVPTYTNGEVPLGQFMTGTNYGVATNELIRRSPATEITATQWRAWLKSSGFLDPDPGGVHFKPVSPTLEPSPSGGYTITPNPPRPEAFDPGYHLQRKCRWVRGVMVRVEFDDGVLECDQDLLTKLSFAAMSMHFENETMSQAISDWIGPDQGLPPSQRSPVRAVMWIADFQSLTVGPPPMRFVDGVPESIRVHATVVYLDEGREPLDLGWIDVPSHAGE